MPKIHFTDGRNEAGVEVPQHTGTQIPSDPRVCDMHHRGLSIRQGPGFQARPPREMHIQAKSGVEEAER